ncbi:MAG TPA: prepilin-type N-terminal cleavage/methylation domain-containing protein [Planctomycetota bacterium]|nr:prepilin-type N-terminal cleavage/methylation domain-containing protein [Planctomycetota bacterium]
MRVLRRTPHAVTDALARGFTLVEVMVVVLIISGIMLAITSVLDSARVSRDTIHNLEETQLAGPAIMDLLERDIRAMITYDMPIESLLRVKSRVVSGLDADSIDFVSTTDSLAAWDIDRRATTNDYGEVGYRLRPNPEDKDLLEIYRRESFGVDDKPFEGGQFIFLHDRVRHFDIQIYTEDGPDADSIEEWNVNPSDTDKMGLPARLSIELTLELAPRIQREQIVFKSADKRTITYRRVIRIPQSMRDALTAPPIPDIPKLSPPGASGSDPGGPGNKSGASSLDGGTKNGSKGQAKPIGSPGARPPDQTSVIKSGSFGG